MPGGGMDMTLPHVEHVHVVIQGLPAFDFNHNGTRIGGENKVRFICGISDGSRNFWLVTEANKNRLDERLKSTAGSTVGYRLCVFRRTPERDDS